ncbi:dethiobiotin synthase [Desulfoluna butyratoxydans]|uniref:ATP-dependent dethiobiotin synthetase BioD n=1 Tax=Desulfoluna butyratoxydans TaxID=231438 RepID=A0A4U8YI52_9BACT|nr:dethiobiotin synthase [Desulfoluna butyratoxydans]VFQ42894.1 dethiobiotin synthase biod [Desulfoluna butyratoxydans]
MSPIRDICITGTDTDVGKSVLSLLVMKILRAQGLDPLYLKPFQTGCHSPTHPYSDPSFVLTLMGGRDEAKDSVLYCFREAKAPYFAAREEGKKIDPEAFKTFIQEKRALGRPLVVEGAGGALVPVTERLNVIDLLAEEKFIHVVAARAGLGTINHTLLTLEAMASRGITHPFVVFIDRDGSTEPVMIAEHMEAVARITGIRPVASIGRMCCIETEADAMAERLLPLVRALGLEAE